MDVFTLLIIVSYFWIGAFYFTVGNLSLKYRSCLSSIQLVALVKSSFIAEYGMDAVLVPFVNDVKKLVMHIGLYLVSICYYAYIGDGI